MPKKGGKRGKGKSTDVPEYVSDDEKLYGNVDDPDPESREYIYDDVDEFHANREKILIDKGYQRPDDGFQSDEEEVLALDSEESDDDEIRDLKAQLRRVKQIEKRGTMDGDLDDQEDDDSEDGLPDSRAWGKKRGKYYGDDDIELKNMDDEEAEAVLEEKEALKLQRLMAEQLDDQDFGLDLFQPPKSDSTDVPEKEEKIVKDLSKLSQREKLKLLQKESPELLTLIEDFKEKLSEVKDKLCPMKDLIKIKGLTGKAVDYVHTKFRLNLNYCTNIVFYLMLKAKQTPVHNHPIIKRLLQYRNLLQQLSPLDEQMSVEIDDIVTRVNNGEDVEFGGQVQPTQTFVRRKKLLANKKRLSDLVSDSDDSEDMYDDHSKPKAKKSKHDTGRFETKEERAALEFYDMMKGGRGSTGAEDEGEQGDTADDLGGDMEVDIGDLDPESEEGKRAITYKMSKNKGLTAHKKKELRNPRVKHRAKFRKANIRRKGMVREARTEVHKYGGELSGIRAGIKRSVKLR